MTKTALITGITGQDGSYLTELLLGKGYEIHGLIRRSSEHKTERIDHLQGKITLHWGDLQNDNHIASLVDSLKPDEIYNLASQSDVRISFDIPEYTGEITGLGTTRLLEAIRKFSPKSKFYQASSSELFGLAPAPQNELSPMLPQNPYAVAKLYAHHMVNIYRKAYNLFACCGILFNHESPRRGENFVTRKITKAAVEVYKGERETLYLGNLEGRRDWGYAPDYVKAMWLITQRNEPDDFVIGTGEAHTVQEYLEETFRLLKLDWEKYVKIDPALFRPTETHRLLADATKARRVLGWKPAVTFKGLVKLMLEAEIKKEMGE